MYKYRHQMTGTGPEALSPTSDAGRMETMRKDWSLRVIELSFDIIVLRLFDFYPAPVHVFKFLESACVLFGLDRSCFEQLLVREMQQYYNVDKLINELIYLLRTVDVPVDKLAQLAQLTKAATYWRLRQFEKTGKVLPVQHSAEELELMRAFVQNFRRIGGLI
jgi:hypothetical protein